MSRIDNAVKDALQAIMDLRAHGGRVHCITNTVAQNFTANVLLACGAAPSMTVSPREAADFTKRADALLINLGTLSDDRERAVRSSLVAAKAAGRPVVLDPVMCHVSPARLAFAAEIMASAPDIFRANADELSALDNAGIPTTLSCHVLTGATDHIGKGDISWTVENGHVWMSKVTAIGCAQGGLMAALAARTEHTETAALAALLWTNIAGELAAEISNGPGTFQAAFIDALHAVSISEIEKRRRVS